MDDDRPIFEITAHIDIAPRQHAQTDFTLRMSSHRGLRGRLQDLHDDGYTTTVATPSGRVFPGTMFPRIQMMDDDLGYGPRAGCEHLMHLVDGTWMLVEDPGPSHPTAE